jgi:hypothetical protein
LALNEVAKYWSEQVKSLIQQSTLVESQARQEASAAEGQTNAYVHGSAALDAYNTRQDILKTTLPYITAAEHASGASKQRLLNIVRDLTAAEERRHAALKLTATLQDIDTRVGSASGNLNSNLADARNTQNTRQLNDKYQANLAVLAQWRNTAVNAGLPTTDIDAYAAKLELLFHHDIQQAYADNLRNHTDWASGVERANLDLTNSLQDWASQSESFIKGWASANQQAFEDFAASGKFSVSSLVSYVEQQFARLAYLKWMSSSINAVGTGIASGIDQVFNYVDSSLGISAAVHHSGGIAGYGLLMRDVPADLFAGARRYHGGGRVANDNLAAGEVPIIAQVGERVQTATEQRSDMLRDEALVSALQRPMVVQMPTAASRGGNVAVHVSNPPGSTTRQTTTTDGDGNTRVDIINEIESHLAGRIVDGNSPVSDAMEGRFNLGRSVA